MFALLAHKIGTVALVVCCAGCGESVNVKVVDAATGAPLSDAHVVVHSTMKDILFGVHEWTGAGLTSAQDGAVHVESLDLNVQNALVVSHAGYYDAEVSVSQVRGGPVVVTSPIKGPNGSGDNVRPLQPSTEVITVPMFSTDAKSER